MSINSWKSGELETKKERRFINTRGTKANNVQCYNHK